MKVAVTTLDNKKAGDIELNDVIFGAEDRADILHRVVNYQLAKRRSGNHKTKGVSEISGTGKKPFKQKGTGNARQGSSRSPLNPGGGSNFGPRPRDYSERTPKKMVKGALRAILTDKVRNGRFVVVKSLDLPQRTKEAAKVIEKLVGDGVSSLLLGAAVDPTRGVQNLAKVEALSADGINVRSLLKREWLVCSVDGVKQLTAYLSQKKES